MHYNIEEKFQGRVESRDQGEVAAFNVAYEEVQITMEAALAGDQSFKGQLASGIPDLFQLADIAWAHLLAKASSPDHQALLQEVSAEKLSNLREWKKRYLREVLSREDLATEFNLLQHQLVEIKAAYEKELAKLESAVTARCSSLLKEVKEAKLQRPALSTAQFRRLVGGEFDGALRLGC